jgi:sugar phosphate isomerase/epimerase
MTGYDGWLSIEHEDEILGRQEGVRRAASFITALMPVEQPDYEVQSVP